MSTPVDSKELGTLVVVVGKARNLPNKSRFGKQDPFCTVAIGEDKQKTKPIKRGGQHPEWDEELRFAITENVDDVLVRSESQSDSLAPSTNGAPPPPVPKDNAAGVITSAALANKSRKGPMGKKGIKALKVACYADDAKEPELIGECVVDIDDVLKKGEVDEWYEFTYRDKYSGEVYLELTFFSNDAPPIKRNVPRPAVHNYGGSANFGETPSSSLSSMASRTRLSGLNASQSVSGMNLYIPPYMQPAPVPSPAQQPAIPPSSSFAELGLPPRHQSSHSLSLPGQPSYPPPQSPNIPLQHAQASLDSLTRPFSSMSIGSSYSTRPSSSMPAPPEPANLGHGYGSHRHSVGGPADAPWGSLLPASQPPPAPTPHPRPMSVNDALPWEQTQRLEEERYRAAATPVPRPVSSQAYAIPPSHTNSPYPHSLPGHRVPSPIPESLRPAAPPQAQMLRTHAHSFSQGSAAAFPDQYRGPSPAPTPPPHSISAPPINPHSTNHYQLPTSSFGSLAQPPAEQYRAASPGYGQYQPQPQANGAYANTASSGPTYQQQAYGNAPPRRDSYPPRPPVQDYQPTSSAHPYDAVSNPAAPYQDPHLAYASPPQPQSSYNHAQPPILPARQPSPAPPQPPANDNGYVPWYQQTQAPQQTPPPPPPSSVYQPPYGQQQQQQQQQQQAQGSQHSLPPPPPVPGHRPVPQPPAPPKPQQVGYYPSDELYAQHQQPQRQDTQTPQPPNGYGHQSRPSYDQASSYGSQQPGYPNPTSSSAGYPSSATSFSPPPQHIASPYQPAAAATSPQPQPQSQPWQAQSSSSLAQYARSPSPQPPLNPSSSGYYAPPQQMHDEYRRAPSPQPPAQQQQNSYYRAPSPQPPSQSGYRAPSPQPPAQNGYRAPSPQPPAQNGYRAPSPQPPAQNAYHRTASPQPQGYQPPYAPETWQSQPPLQAQVQVQQLAPPNRSHSPMPDPQRAPSPAQPQSQQQSQGHTTKADWRSYMQSLGTRSPSPQPPAKDAYSHHQQPQQPQQQQQQQQQWYTPPPTLPASIQPPDGWRSTLPATKDGHQWHA